jgi:hypothetical protein
MTKQHNFNRWVMLQNTTMLILDNDTKIPFFAMAKNCNFCPSELKNKMKK